MKRLRQSTVAVVVLMTFIGCGGGGGSEAIQSQATASAKKSPTFPSAANILTNGDFEGVVLENELDVPPGWLANEGLFFQAPPNWGGDINNGNVSVRPNYANRVEHYGVKPQQGLYMAVLTTWGSAPSSLGQVLVFPEDYPSRQVFKISFWHNLYAEYDYEGHPTFAAKLQAWLYEYETQKYIHLFETAYKDKDPYQTDTPMEGGSIRGWKYFSTSRSLDTTKQYALFFQILNDVDVSDERVMGFIDDVIVTPFPNPPGRAGDD